MKKNLPGFTVIEILIATAFIALMATLVFSANFKKPFLSARDSKRKTDLRKISSIFEDYYNDHSRYPRNLDISFGSSFFTYSKALPQDPISSPGYFYYEDPSGNGQYFAVYTNLENLEDPDIEKSGCGGAGCNPSGSPQTFNYVITSPNAKIVNNALISN